MPLSTSAARLVKQARTDRVQVGFKRRFGQLRRASPLIGCETLLLHHSLLSLTFAAMLAASPALAQNLSIEKERDGIRLNADDVPVEQAVQVLSERFGFQVRFIRSGNQVLNGSRSGSVLDILNWVLNGNDRAIFMAKGRTDQIARVVVFGPSGVPPPPAPPQQQPGDVVFPQDGPIDNQPTAPPQSDPQGQIPPLDGGISGYGDEANPPQ